jgi:hypothetical protein
MVILIQQRLFEGDVLSPTGEAVLSVDEAVEGMILSSLHVVDLDIVGKKTR